MVLVNGLVLSIDSLKNTDSSTAERTSVDGDWKMSVNKTHLSKYISSAVYLRINSLHPGACIFDSKCVIFKMRCSDNFHGVDVNGAGT